MPFQVVGHVFSGAGGQVQVVELADRPAHLTIDNYPELLFHVADLSAT
jgi:hypothetical protein